MIRRGRASVGGGGLAAIAVVALLASGCGYGGVATAGDHADAGNGQTLFLGAGGCAGCHTLQAAGSQGTVGPDLDNAFAEDLNEGYSRTDIENVVLDQIRLGSGPIATYTNPEHGVKGLTTQQGMPAHLVTGQNAIDVAYYVSMAVSQNYVKQVNLASLKTGASIFKLGPCAGCHTLAAAGTHGTTGPNLDQYKPPLTYAVVLHQVTVGGGLMPAFASTLTPAQIKAVATYVSSVAGKK